MSAITLQSQSRLMSHVTCKQPTPVVVPPPKFECFYVSVPDLSEKTCILSSGGAELCYELSQHAMTVFFLLGRLLLWCDLQRCEYLLCCCLSHSLWFIKANIRGLHTCLHAAAHGAALVFIGVRATAAFVARTSCGFVERLRAAVCVCVW